MRTSFPRPRAEWTFRSTSRPQRSTCCSKTPPRWCVRRGSTPSASSGSKGAASRATARRGPARARNSRLPSAIGRSRRKRWCRSSSASRRSRSRSGSWLRCDGNRDRLAASLQANGDLRKPVEIRRGPATVTGSCSGSTPLGAITREGGPLARSQETSPFAPPADPSREGWWRCARGAGASPSPHRRGWAFFVMRRWLQRTHLAPVVALAVAACARGEHAPVRGGIAVTDDAGRRVTLAAPARRIVSLLPSFTEILFAIGAGDRLVGRTTWCDYPPEALAVPSVGDGMPPSVEAVAARRPELVVLYRAGPNVTAAAQLA